jgi:L-2,4-diaminobutyric acid acetyltransferase
MLSEVIARPSCSNVTAIETTISPSNRASWALFESLAKKLGAVTSRADFSREKDFGDEGHEAEVLLRIGPIDPEERGKLCKFLTS